MDMIFYSIDAKQSAVPFFNNAPNVFVQFVAMFIGYCLFAVFCCENNLVYNLSITHKVGK